MTKNQKAVVAITAGIIVVLTGAYALIALEPNKSEETAVATDTSVMTFTETSTIATPLNLSPSQSAMKTANKPAVTKPDLAAVTPPAAAAAELMIPVGTTVDVKIQTHISSRDAKVGDQVTATTIEDVVVNGKTIVPAGSTVIGEVTEVKPAAETKSAAVLKIAFTRIGEYSAHMAMVLPDLDARARSANRAADAALVLGGAGAGAVIGHQVSGRRGTLPGAVIGGAAGAIAAANLGANVQLKSGETATLRFTENVRL